MARPRQDDAAWRLQRAAQLRLTIEERLRQNDAMTKVALEMYAARSKESLGREKDRSVVEQLRRIRDEQSGD